MRERPEGEVFVDEVACRCDFPELRSIVQIGLVIHSCDHQLCAEGTDHRSIVEAPGGRRCKITDQKRQETAVDTFGHLGAHPVVAGLAVFHTHLAWQPTMLRCWQAWHASPLSIVLNSQTRGAVIHPLGEIVWPLVAVTASALSMVPWS